ncbi:hypothetical protein CQW49_00155 [Methylosinus trichosporium OB3b]|uniref:TonB-dependent receptor plug domain-containing protein n=1 Tax=Methylosinus trichosporium (strain ATCC 35070 / NCIMB 11131 / UNIQEM 75 / OB3b) TaxID=595536 RepID=A0A2D2CUR5_METT3|nr:hypothetical protein CQW49_00155 [Methylosinus trichosporium OB3b]
MSIILAQNDGVRSDAGAEALPPIDVGAEARTDAPGDPGGASDPKAYRHPNASTETKTSTPVMETPISIQVVPQQVLQDQQAVRLDKALENVSGVYTLPSGGSYGASADNFLIRGSRPTGSIVTACSSLKRSARSPRPMISPMSTMSRCSRDRRRSSMGASSPARSSIS